ncbi:hypothetical protein ACSLO2_27540, partial [Escherichia coli]
ISFTVIRPRRLELFKTLFDELKNNPYMREPIEHGDSLSDKEKNIYKGLAEFISQKIRDEHDICLGQFESEELLDEILKRVIP